MTKSFTLVLMLILQSAMALAISDADLQKRVLLLDTEPLQILLPSDDIGSAELFAQSVKKHWTFCEYTFITQEEYASKWGNTRAPIFGFYSRTMGSGSSSSGTVLSHHVGLFLKDEKSYESSEVDEVLTNIEFPNGFEGFSKEKKAKYVVLYDFYVLDLQRQLTNAKLGLGMNNENKVESSNYAKFYGNGKAELSGKTILINKADVKADFNMEKNLESLRKNTGVNDLNMVMVSEDVILKAIADRERDKLFYPSFFTQSAIGVNTGVNGTLVSTESLEQLGWFSSFSKKGIALNKAVMLGISAALIVVVIVIPIVRA